MFHFFFGNLSIAPFGHGTYVPESDTGKLPYGMAETSDFFGQKYGGFASKVRMFVSKKSDVFDFRKRKMDDRKGRGIIAGYPCPEDMEK